MLNDFIRTLIAENGGSCRLDHIAIYMYQFIPWLLAAAPGCIFQAFPSLKIKINNKPTNQTRVKNASPCHKLYPNARAKPQALHELQVKNIFQGSGVLG